MIGNPGSFAIEFELDADPCGPWLNGQARLWIGGKAVGAGWRWMSLQDLLLDVEQGRRDWDRRENPSLFSESAGRLFELLDGALYRGSDGATEARAIAEQWARHEILPAGVFAAKVFAVDGPDATRILTGQSGEALREVFVGRGEADSVLRAVHDDLQRLLLATGAQPGR